jgi:hypothetical protein
MTTNSGFLVVKRYEALYREFAARPDFTLPIYALPLCGSDPERNTVRYRGLDRDAVTGRKCGTLAEVRVHELEQDGAVDDLDNFLATFAEAEDVLQWAEMESPGAYEIIWARIAGTGVFPPDRFVCLGFEPSYFTGDHFSAICDCMCFPRWHGTDPDGTLFRRYFDQLNPRGLFSSAQLASEFLAYYLSFDWTETGDYEIAEVWAASVAGAAIASCT